MLTPKKKAQLRSAPLTGRNKLGTALQLANMTQVQAAEKLAYLHPDVLWPQSRVSDHVRGAYVDMPLESGRAWATLFGVAVEDLFPAPDQVAAASEAPSEHAR